MSEQPAIRSLDGPRVPLARLGLVVAVFVLAGAGAGWVWEQLWEPPRGLTYEGRWFLEPAGPDVAFQGVALFVLVAFPLGLVLAAVAGLWREHELATAVTVLAASCLATVVMYAVGTALGPADPQALAAGKPDYTDLPGELALTAPDPDQVPWHSPALVALPAGAMAGLVGTYLFAGRGLGRQRRG